MKPIDLRYAVIIRAAHITVGTLSGFRVVILIAAGCAATACATVPAVPTGSSASFFDSPADVPVRVSVTSTMLNHHEPAGQILRSELPSLGFVVVHEDVAGNFDAEIRWSDFSPVLLHVELTDADSGRILWRAELSQRWDIYASVVKASENNAREAIRLLRRDLESLRSGRRNPP